MQIFQCESASALSADALSEVCTRISEGKIICLPTDTVYGIGADPFNTDAVTALLKAKSRTRQMPPPVLVADVSQAQELIAPSARTGNIASITRDLIAHFWPGALTIILPVHPNIGWDLGQTNSTVALRMPDHPLARHLLRHTGPLAVTSANKTGQPPARNISQAIHQLSDAVSVYIDGGETSGGVPSTIVRLNLQHPHHVEVLREGAIEPAYIEKKITGITLTPVK